MSGALWRVQAAQSRAKKEANGVEAFAYSTRETCSTGLAWPTAFISLSLFLASSFLSYSLLLLLHDTEPDSRKRTRTARHVNESKARLRVETPRYSATAERVVPSSGISRIANRRSRDTPLADRRCRGGQNFLRARAEKQSRAQRGAGERDESPIACARRVKNHRHFERSRKHASGFLYQ